MSSYINSRSKAMYILIYSYFNNDEITFVKENNEGRMKRESLHGIMPELTLFKLYLIIYLFF